MNDTATQRFQLDAGTAATLAVVGELSFDTAAAALHSIQSALRDPAIKQVDLAGVTASDSAGLACVLAVVADASRSGRSLDVVHMPAGMRALAQVCEVDRMIG